MRTLLTTSTAVALFAAFSPAAGAQDAPAGFISAYEAYASARLGLTDSDPASPEFAAQVEAAAAARATLESLCTDLGTPGLAACLDQYIAPELRIPGDTDPLPEPVAEPETAPEPAAEPEPAPEPEAAPEPEPQPEPEAAPPAETSSEPVTEPEQPAMEEETSPDAEQSVEPEQQPAAEPEAAPEPAAAPEPEPAPEPEAAPETQEASPELTAAYESYASARLNIAGLDPADPDAAAQIEAAAAARTDLENLCAELGVPDLAACLDQYIAADMRVPGDTDPLPEIAGETTGAEEVTEPEAAPEETGQPAGETASEEPAEPVEDADVPPEEIAPVLDSAKEELEAGAAGEAAEEQPADTTAEPVEQAAPEEQPADTTEPAEAEQTPPESDTAAQAETVPEQVESIEAEQGEAVTAEEEQETFARRQPPRNAEVVRRDDDGFRIVLQIGDQYVLRNSDRPRLGGDASDRYVERLRGGRIRETIERPNGSRVVTIYNRNGDILRRSRFTPDGQEYVLVYVDDDYQDDVLEWHDPGADLPPLRLNIPVREYIMDAEQAGEEEVLTFLDQPPVEQVQRLYSVDEVKRSARIRDMVRRLEIGDLTFDTGSATIPPDEIGSLNKVARAMQALLDDNPAETFLIEGHTDAVGSDIANLELSDRRAETVAVILSEYFDIPPENLATQGYGERYLKIRTEGPERLNRRVTVKRITPLVSPVASR